MRRGVERVAFDLSHSSHSVRRDTFLRVSLPAGGGGDVCVRPILCGPRRRAGLARTSYLLTPPRGLLIAGPWGPGGE